MKRTIGLTKIRYEDYKSKSNLVTLELELREREWGMEFSCCGNIWNAHRTDIVCGGQCLDTIAEYVHTPLFKEIYRFWKLYHLNGMHAGTVEQEEAIEKWKAEGNEYDYEEVCKYLYRIGLYVVEHEGEPYMYGSAWLHREIPKEDLERIKQIILEGK